MRMSFAIRYPLMIPGKTKDNRNYLNSRLSTPGKLDEDLNAWAVATKAVMDAFNRADSRCTYFENIEDRLRKMANENKLFDSYDLAFLLVFQ